MDRSNTLFSHVDIVLHTVRVLESGPHTRTQFCGEYPIGRSVFLKPSVSCFRLLFCEFSSLCHTTLERCVTTQTGAMRDDV